MPTAHTGRNSSGTESPTESAAPAGRHSTRSRSIVGSDASGVQISY